MAASVESAKSAAATCGRRIRRTIAYSPVERRSVRDEPTDQGRRRLIYAALRHPAYAMNMAWAIAAASPMVRRPAA
jgi:hypothetical protein